MPVQQKQERIRHNAGKHQTPFDVYVVLNLPGKYLFLVPASQLMALNLAAYAPLQQKCGRRLENRVSVRNIRHN